MKGGVFKQVQVTFMFVLLVSSTHCQLQYYILPSSTGDDQDCPTGKVCHSLSYCINDLKRHSNITNVTFIFLSGEHLLNETVDLEGYYLYSLNLSFKGQGQWVQGTHESVNQSTVIIRCTNNTIDAFFIEYVNSVYYGMLTIADCANGIILLHTNRLHLHHVSLQNNSQTGLACVDQYYTTPFVGIVESCTFYRNCLENDPASRCSQAWFKNTFNSQVLINVTDTTFSFSRYGNGLDFRSVDITNAEYIVTNTSFLSNNGTVQETGSLLMVVEQEQSVVGRPVNFLINVTNCLFINNSDLAGGMLIYYNASITPSVVVTNTQFINNSGILFGGMVVEVFNTCIAANVKISDSLFFNNSGSAAGGMGIIYSTSFTPSLIVTNTQFIKNSNYMYVNLTSLTQRVGGMLVKSSAMANVTITNSLFINNTGNFTGGLFILFTDSDVTAGNIKFVNCHFQSNNDTALVLLSTNRLTGTHRVPSLLTMRNVTFDKNIGGSFYSVWYFSIALMNVSVTSTIPSRSNLQFSAAVLTCQGYTRVYISNMSLLNNNMTALHAVKCYIIFQDSPSIIANNTSPHNGGGIWLDSQSVLESKDERGTVNFINNTAVLKGGAIYSEAKLISSERTATYASKLCSIPLLAANFVHNEALYGNDFYGGRFSGCVCMYPKTIFFFSFSGMFTLVLDCNALKARNQWTVFDSIDHFQPSNVSSDPVGVCQCTDNGTVDCSNRLIHKKVYPGQSISLSLVTVGMCGGVTPGLLAVQADGINITLGSSDQQTVHSCKNFNYQLKQSKKINGVFTLQTDSTSALSGSSLQIEVLFQQCPYGLQLRAGVCKCNAYITKSLGDLVQCNITSLPPITRSGNNWLSYNDQYNCTVVHRYCPFDYCNTSTVSLSLDQPDVQCTLNRSGTLCGQCQSGLSLMLGSNQCGSCDNKYLSLVAVFIVAGIALVVFLLVCNLTVSMGSINGLLFYANIVKLNEPVFFPNGASIPVLSQFISWLNLDLGIQTCFFNGLDGYWKTWLQFVFPIYIWILIGGIIIGSHYFGRVSRLFGNNTVPVLATLILMSYSKLLRTITNVLMVATIRCGAEQWNVWSVDGNIHYLSAKRLPLFVVALVFLLIGILYTFLVFTTQWLQHYSGRYCRSSYDPVVKLKPLIDAYSGPYKDKYRYWTGLLLIVRVIVTAIFSYTSSVTPQMNSYVIVIISVLMSMKLSQSVYRNTLLNRLELFFILNLALLSLLNALCVQMKWSVSSFVSFASVALSLAIFLAIVCIHAAIIIKRKYNITFCWEKKQNTQGEEEEEQQLLREESPEVELYSPARVINRRESLIFDLNID